MKLKLIAAAAFAVCGSSAFAACTAPDTNSDNLVRECAPQATIYMTGATAQAPAIHSLLLSTSTVFDLTKAIAIIAPTTGGTSSLYYGSKTSNTTTTSSVTTTASSESGTGAKNTVIYYGTGAAGTTNAARRVAIVYNYANGSFAGVKQMTEGTGTTNPNTGASNGEPLSQGLLTTAQQTAGTTLTCVVSGSTSSGAAVVWSANSGSPIIPSYACTGNSFNYLTTAPAGGAVGVQLALADVAPRQAVLGVLTKNAWNPNKYPLTVTGMQGFGIMVNDLALKALIRREVAAGRLASSCDSTAIGSLATTSTLTAACQPSIRSSDMTALITGKATAAMISGGLDAAGATDATKITYWRRVPFSGTQAASTIAFAGQAAIEGFASDLLTAGTVTATGYTAPILGTAASNGDYTYTSTSGNYVNYAKSSGSAVITGVSADTTTYAFGIVSLEKVWSATKTSSDLKGGSWVKLDGISPNYNMSTGVHDTKQRVGMQAGYPFQFEMVALKAAGSGAQKAVVSSIVTALQTDTYNLPGIAYIGSTDSTYAATFYRGGLANNYAPLRFYATSVY
jgi:hypothetical protein